MTVNEYLPGQGIAAHVDTHDAFGHTLLSLSLASGVVMDFRHCPGAVLRTEPHAIRQTALLPANPRASAANEGSRNSAPGTAAPQTARAPNAADTLALPLVKPTETLAEVSDEDGGADEAEARLLLWLPPRSLLVLSDDSRYLIH